MLVPVFDSLVAGGVVCVRVDRTATAIPQSRRGVFRTVHVFMSLLSCACGRRFGCWNKTMPAILFLLCQHLSTFRYGRAVDMRWCTAQELP